MVNFEEKKLNKIDMSLGIKEKMIVWKIAFLAIDNFQNKIDSDEFEKIAYKELETILN